MTAVLMPNSYADANVMPKVYKRKKLPLDIRDIAADKSANRVHPDCQNQVYLTRYFEDTPTNISSRDKQTDSSRYESTSRYENTSRYESTAGGSSKIDSWASISHNWTPGNNSERSSVFAFGEDDFERRASSQVNKLFDQIDSMLFETNEGPLQLINECQEWSTCFPHLRILGEQMLQPQDTGYEIIPRKCISSLQYSSENTIDNLLEHSSGEDMLGLDSIQGLSIHGRVVDSSTRYDTDTNSTELYNHEYEEVFAMDGNMEELIAMDYKESEEENSEKIAQHAESKKCKMTGFPPITPHACLKNNLSAFCFDFLWSEIISWIRPLLKQYLQRIEIDKMSGSSNRVINSSFPGIAKFDDSQTILSSEASLIDIRLTDKYQVICLNNSQLTSKLPTHYLTMVQQEVLQFDETHLDGVLQISTKALQNRKTSNCGNVEELSIGNSLVLMQNDAGFNSSRRPSSDARFNTRQVSASLRKTLGRGRLLPLSLERTRTPSFDDDRVPMKSNEILRGRALTTIPDGIDSPLLSFQRNGALPPLNLIGKDYSTVTKANMRVRSAVNEKEKFSRYRNYVVSNDVQYDARPSTTHTLYRSETPYNIKLHSGIPQSSNYYNGLSTITTLGKSESAGVIHLNVTGSGINPHYEMTHSSLVMDSGSENVNDIVHSQWGGSMLSRRTKQHRIGST